jgi:hypothetical protein
MGKVVKVQSTSSPVEHQDVTELLASLCYYYPQYTLSQASKLPLKTVLLLLKVARQHEAVKYHNLTQIAAAPHTNKGAGVRKLSSHYENIMRSG